ncbi:MAG: 50S ribosomal protein L10 [Flavobacteriales bacterium]|nr:50S ribosomal protein L10 [Flavobacteriales bacterium]
MTREDKDKVIGELSEYFTNYKFVYVTDTSAMSALDTNNMRRVFFKNNVKVRVAKNTLIIKALEKSNVDFKELKDTLKGTTALLFAEDAKVAAVAIKEFRKKGTKPVLKGAYIDSDVFIGDDKLDVLNSLKSREELIGEIITILQSPAKNVVSALQSGGGKLAGIVKTLSER